MSLFKIVPHVQTTKTTCCHGLLHRVSGHRYQSNVLAGHLHVVLNTTSFHKYKFQWVQSTAPVLRLAEHLQHDMQQKPCSEMTALPLQYPHNLWNAYARLYSPITEVNMCMLGKSMCCYKRKPGMPMHCSHTQDTHALCCSCCSKHPTSTTYVCMYVCMYVRTGAG